MAHIVEYMQGGMVLVRSPPLVGTVAEAVIVARDGMLRHSVANARIVDETGEMVLSVSATDTV